MNDGELLSYLEERLDGAWRNTGLEGTVRRPESDPAALVERFRDGNADQGFFACVQAAGFESWGSGEENGGPVFFGANNQKLDPAEQLVFYSCFADNPSNGSYGGLLLTPEEYDYLYTYYQDWVIPCLALEGYTVLYVPTREEYRTGFGFGWIPYFSLDAGTVGEDPYGLGAQPDMMQLAARCGDPFPGMPYGEQYGF